MSVLLLFCTRSYAQDDVQKAAIEAAQALTEEKPVEQPKQKRFKYWTSSMLTNVNFAQTGLTDWAAGGDDTFSLKGLLDASANYKKNAIFWNNRLMLEYGFIYASSKPILQKNADRIYYSSSFGYQVKPKLYISATPTFDTQFSTGWIYGTPGPDQLGDKKLEELSKKEQIRAWKDARVARSDFLSPATARLGLGIDWTPGKWIKVNVAPATGDLVIVQDPRFRRANGMEVQKKYAELDPQSEDYKALQNSGELYKNTRLGFGMQVKTDVNVVVNNNLAYVSTLTLFSNYLKNPQNIKVDWYNRLSWHVAKYFSFVVSFRMIYDDTVLIKSEKDIDKYPNGTQRLQMMETVEFGFSYTLRSK